MHTAFNTFTFLCLSQIRANICEGVQDLRGHVLCVLIWLVIIFVCRSLRSQRETMQFMSIQLVIIFVCRSLRSQRCTAWFVLLWSVIILKYFLRSSYFINLNLFAMNNVNKFYPTIFPLRHVVKQINLPLNLAYVSLCT